MTITEKIITSIKELISSGTDLPFDLTHTSIAQYYEVSLTPARNAVIALVDEGVILRKPNGRLCIKSKKTGGAATNQSCSKALDAKPKLQKEWHNAIIREVINLSIKQNSDYLREEATAAKFNVSRTVVRQLFSHLAGAGLMEHVPRCGWRVQQFNEKEMMDYLQIREMMELEALRLARPKMHIKELQSLLAMNQPSAKRQATPRLDNQLHAYWIDRCDNRYIQDFFRRYGDYYSALFDHASVGKETMYEMATEHCKILQCLIDSDWSGAKKALTHHIRGQQDNVLRFVSFSKN